jgi:hypothetical protein
MNPFEIRAEMLKMAQEYLDQQYKANLDLAVKTFDELAKLGKVTVADWDKYIPKMYSFEEITQKANELYSFVKEK